MGQSAAITKALALHQSGQLQTAESHYLQVLAEDKANDEALYLLGSLYFQLGQLEAAQASLEQAISYNDRMATYHCNLALVYQKQEKLAQAEDEFSKALELKPDFAEAHSNLGALLRESFRFIEARQSLMRALQLKPDFVDAWYNLGCIDSLEGHLEQALACFDKALSIDSANLAARWNKALAHLKKGELEPGWRLFNAPDLLYHYRRKTPYPYPYWQGESLSGKTIVVFAEQGIGDQVLLASMLPDLQRLAGRVIIECDSRLVSLYGRSFPDLEVVPLVGIDKAAPELTGRDDVDYQVALASLGQHFRPNLASFPSMAAYLCPEKKAVAKWKEWLDSLGPDLKVGVTWRSSIRQGRALRHAIPLVDLAPLLETPNCCFISIQYDQAQSEIQALYDELGLRVHQPPLDLFNDIEGLTALVAALDLTITAFNSTALLAGAVGGPVWLWKCASGFLEIMDTDRMPWYPNVRIYAQTELFQWQSVIQSMGKDLHALPKPA